MAAQEKIEPMLILERLRMDEIRIDLPAGSRFNFGDKLAGVAERKLYVKWYKLYFNDILVDDVVLYNYYHYGIPNEEPRVYKTFKNFNDFYSSYKYVFENYKNCIFRKIVKVGNTIIKKEDIKITIMVYDKPYVKEQQNQIITKHNCDYWLKEFNIEEFSNLCKDYGFTSINIK